MNSFEAITKIISNPSWDVIVLFFFISVGFFYGISAGKSKLISLLLSLYVSGFLFENFSYLDKLIGMGNNLIETFLSRIFIFFVLVFLINILLSKVITSSEGSGKKWWQAFLLSFLSSGLFFSYVFHLFPAKEIFTFSPMVQGLFASQAAFFWWLTLPLVALFLSRR